MTDDNERGYRVDDRRGQDHGQDHGVEGFEARPSLTPDLDGLFRRRHQGRDYVFEFVNGELHVLSVDGIGELRHTWVSCPELEGGQVCAERKMQISTDPITTHADCRRNPKNAAMGALYPSGLPNPDQRQRQVSMRRALDNFSEEGIEEVREQQVRDLARALGVDPNL